MDSVSEGNGTAKEKKQGTVAAEQEMQQLDGFELVEEIGRGGMGVIFRARDLAFDRDIAIKFLQNRYTSTSTHALRFLEEARITGQLQHPGIPAVHQVGRLANGRPFLVMKLIRGFTLDQIIWNKKSKTDRSIVKGDHIIPENYLGIFESICQAVGYAHAHHVIHRDLKPHNIMVGAFGEVQVMDWGLAKYIQPDVQQRNLEFEKQDPFITLAADESEVRTSNSNLTAAGSVLGTPGYMAPEQALGANEQLDTRADVFGLGGILATMLTGQPPFVGENPDATRMLAALGMITPCFERLDSSQGDPDLIALAKRCLAVQRGERPLDGGEVAKEVARLRALADDRVKQAEVQRAKAEVYAQEQRKRWRNTLWAALIVVSVLLAGIIASTWGFLRAAAKEAEAVKSADQEHRAKLAEKAQREKAVAKEMETQSILDFMLNRVIAAARPENWEGGKGYNVKLRDALDGSLQFISEEFSKQPVIEARLRLTLGQSFWFLGDYALAEKQLSQARELNEKHLGSTDRQTIQSMLELAKVQSSLGQQEPALKWREQAYRTCLETLGVDELLTQRAMSALSASYEKLGRHSDVMKLREDVVRLAKQKLGATHAFTLISMTNLALTNYQLGKRDEAIEMLKETAALQEKHHGATNVYTLATLSNLAVYLDHLGKYTESLPIHLKVLDARRVALGQDHPDTLKTMRNLAFSYNAQGRTSEAYDIVRSALPLHEKRLGKDHAETLVCLQSNITCLFDLNRSNEAVPLINDCLQRTKGQPANKDLESVMYLLRFRHEHGQRSMASCIATLAEWEKLLPLDGENTFELCLAWAQLAQLKKENGSDGIAEADKAMGYLQQASEKGWNVVKAMEDDKNLAGLRGRDDFRVLMTKLKGKK
ncbi:MAG: serine/threonine protein kinase [Planctomycetia bacterium]|nr:serine/threonine protein kinase [Planctomycetia bacterium]